MLCEYCVTLYGQRYSYICIRTNSTFCELYVVCLLALGNLTQFTLCSRSINTFNYCVLFPIINW